MISALVSLIIFIIVLGLVFWLVRMLPIPQPFLNILIVLIVLVALIVLVDSMGFVGHGAWIR